MKKYFESVHYSYREYTLRMKKFYLFIMSYRLLYPMLMINTFYRRSEAISVFIVFNIYNFNVVVEL